MLSTKVRTKFSKIVSAKVTFCFAFFFVQRQLLKKAQNLWVQLFALKKGKLKSLLMPQKPFISDKNLTWKIG